MVINQFVTKTTGFKQCITNFELIWLDVLSIVHNDWEQIIVVANNSKHYFYTIYLSEQITLFNKRLKIKLCIYIYIHICIYIFMKHFAMEDMIVGVFTVIVIKDRHNIMTKSMRWKTFFHLKIYFLQLEWCDRSV